jgi:hypothetical protein
VGGVNVHAGESPCYMFRGSGHVKYHEVVRRIAKRIPGVFEVVHVNLHVCCSKVTKALHSVSTGVVDWMPSRDVGPLRVTRRKVAFQVQLFEAARAHSSGREILVLRQPPRSYLYILELLLRRVPWKNPYRQSTKVSVQAVTAYV